MISFMRPMIAFMAGVDRPLVAGPSVEAVEWSKAKWQPKLHIKASSYRPLRLFDVPLVEDRLAMYGHLSKDGRWMYVHKVLPKGGVLETYQGSRRGHVWFDGEVIIPALFHRSDPQGNWSSSPFMSLTPMETLSLAPGTRLAKGHTVIAGLGMGHQLIEVSKKKSVKKITLVEKSEGLIAMVWDALRPHLGKVDLDIIVGDAYDVLPKLKADVALVDIFPYYGGNRFRRKTPSIPKVWCWGSSDVRCEDLRMAW